MNRKFPSRESVVVKEVVRLPFGTSHLCFLNSGTPTAVLADQLISEPEISPSTHAARFADYLLDSSVIRK